MAHGPPRSAATGGQRTPPCGRRQQPRIGEFEVQPGHGLGPGRRRRSVGAGTFADFFFASRFRDRFGAKGRFRAYLQAVPTALIIEPHAALIGAAAAIESWMSRLSKANDHAA